jgi:hypothetical protein
MPKYRYISEKYDGMRALWMWTERRLYTKSGKMFQSPDEFTKGLPQNVLDGELWYIFIHPLVMGTRAHTSGVKSACGGKVGQKIGHAVSHFTHLRSHFVRVFPSHKG